MKLIPMKGRVILKTISEEKRASGIYIPNAKNDNIAEVVAVSESNNLKIGDKVIFSKFGATEIDNYIVVEEKEILAKVKED